MNKKRKLLLAASVVIWLAVAIVLDLIFETLGFDVERTSFIGIYSSIIGVLVAIRSYWFLTSYEPDKDDKSIGLGWWYFLYGSSVWVVIMYLGSLINIRPALVEEILGIILTIVFIFIVYMNFKSKIDKIRDELETEQLKKVQEEKERKLIEIKKEAEEERRQHSEPKSFKLDFDKLDKMMDEITPEAFQKARDELTAEQAYRPQKPINEDEDLPKVSLFDWDKVTGFAWWDGMPAVLVETSESAKAFSKAIPKDPWREVNFNDVFSEARRVSESVFHSKLERFNNRTD